MPKTKKLAKRSAARTQAAKPASGSTRTGVGRGATAGKSAIRAANAKRAGRSAVSPKPVAVATGTALCPECYAVYYDKHWHSPELVPADVRTGAMPEEKCEACRSGAAYAGEVIVEGLTDAADRAEAVSLIRNVGKRAARRDPLERIVRLHEDGPIIRVFVSENQLAVSIGKQLDRARKGGQLDIVWSEDDKPVHVHWSAPAR